MAPIGTQSTTLCLVWALSIAFIMNSDLILARKSIRIMNVVDKCWRKNPKWSKNRQELAMCSIGYVGKMTNNIGHDLKYYVVTDPSDDALNPKPGTLRYATTSIEGKVWITFQRNMTIKLIRPLLVNSFTTIDGRGAKVEIAYGACLVLNRVTDVIIHGLRIHRCLAQAPGRVMGPNRWIMPFGKADGDAIRVLTSSRIWIDHNTLFNCEDGLIDVTRGSTNVTVSNNWLMYQNKVMLFGHNDGFIRDKDMKATFAFNRFGPHCNQRMPRIRYGYAHVVNNIYLGWGIYAIGGTSNPSVKSQANLFIAPNGSHKEITWANHGQSKSNFNSVEDVFENGASFKETDDEGIALKPKYGPDQIFPVADGKTVRSLTRSAGALNCRTNAKC